MMHLSTPTPTQILQLVITDSWDKGQNMSSTEMQSLA